MSDHSPVRRTADFSERALAFAADYALFALLWAAAVKATAPELPVFHNPQGSTLTLLAAALFLVYQAFFSCEGRVSLGKALLGLRVARHDGEPLSLGEALFRAAGYIPSSILSLGFFWSLLDPKGRAWHDLAAGSLVLAPERAPARLRLYRAATGLLLVAFAGAWGWQNLYEARYLRLMTVSYAQAGLEEVHLLQKRHKKRHGRYAGSLQALSSVSTDPQGFLRDASALYRLPSFRFRADRDAYAVVARARDTEGTLVAAVGP